MGITSKTVTLASAALGLAVFSQAPEFAQQYRQRIGGAIDELRIVVTDFDRDAANSQLSRIQALEQLVKAPVKFSRDRGQSMTRTVNRFEVLGQQQEWIENAHPFTRPLFVMRNPDEQLINNAWEIYEPGVPLTSSGFVWGGVGGLIAMMIARMGIGGVRKAGHARSARKLAANIELESTGLKNGGALEDVSTLEVGGQEIVALDNPSPETGSAPDYQGSKIRQAMAQARGIPDEMRVSPATKNRATYAKTEAVRDRDKAAKEIDEIRPPDRHELG